MTRHAREAVSLAGATALGESALVALMTTEWANVGAQILLFVFLVGPLVFLAVLTWRRRNHPTRSRVLFFVTALVAVGGMGVLGYDLYRFNTDRQFRLKPNMNGVLVPVVQWVVIVGVWVWLVIVEAREKQRARVAPIPVPGEPGGSPRPPSDKTPQSS
jgi:hypothetical protein